MTTSALEDGMSQLANLTKCFKSARVNWKLRGRAFAKQFEKHARAVRGVYAHLDLNTSKVPIRDKNRGGRGRVIVLGSAMALKYGKFGGGLPRRMLQNYDHFHRRPFRRPRQHGIFPDVLTCLFVMDLSHLPKDAIQPLETEWNRSIRDVLEARDLIHPGHIGRGESINLRRRMSAQELLAILRPIARTISARKRPTPKRRKPVRIRRRMHRTPSE
jgi:hypothetical protein